MTTYDNGDLVRCSALFETITGTAIDPTTVRFAFRNPAGTTTTYLYGTDAQLIKDSTGNYHVDIDANADGRWHYRFYSSGTGQAAGESHFRVESVFV